MRGTPEKIYGWICGLFMAALFHATQFFNTFFGTMDFLRILKLIFCISLEIDDIFCMYIFLRKFLPVITLGCFKIMHLVTASIVIVISNLKGNGSF